MLCRFPYQPLILEASYDALDDQRQKVLVLLEIAKMWEEKLGSREGAITPFAKILEIDRLHDFAF